MWIRVPPGQTEIRMKFREPMIDAEPVLEKLTQATKSNEDTHTETNNLFIHTIMDLEERIVKFGNVDNMKAHKRKRRGGDKFYNADDSFFDDDNSRDRFKSAVLIPSMDDYFIFKGTISDFKKSDLLDYKLTENDHLDKLSKNDQTKRLKKVHLNPDKILDD